MYFVMSYHDIPYDIIICRIRNIERTLLRKGSMLPEEVRCTLY